MHYPTNRITHTMTFCYTSRGALAETRKIKRDVVICPLIMCVILQYFVCLVFKKN